jgi:hypothetical protein
MSHYPKHFRTSSKASDTSFSTVFRGFTDYRLPFTKNQDNHSNQEIRAPFHAFFGVFGGIKKIPLLQ